MNLKNAYLCPDCDEVFSIADVLHIEDHIHYPICPICGNKNVLNLARVLNRKEEKNDETYFDYASVHGTGVPSNKPVVSDSPDNGTREDAEQTADRSSKSGDREPRGENPFSNLNGLTTNFSVAGITALSHVFRILTEAERNIVKELPGADADSEEYASPASDRGCEHPDWRKDSFGETCDYKRRYSAGDSPLQGVEID